MSPIQAGDVLIIPSSSGPNKLVKGNIKWSQDWGKDYSQDYYMGLVEVKGKGGQKALCFIQHDRYQPSGDYEVTIDHNWQYGQKDKSGQGRFAVLQNSGYKMFQHRFTKAAIENLAVNKSDNAKEVGIALGYGDGMAFLGQLQPIIDNASKLFGDNMHQF
ncbi:hypothetical protein B0J17DRAFT_631078 [Rhizoctonia solani]|nr:hypothetical protein B0J17DRAFT_631077 [Rhizoctonia solani]KAH7334278.1 hypothetical protein B0J17DRAFT_631078 [Rhizoctonia solani]